jgi:hypothetical protein
MSHKVLKINNVDDVNNLGLSDVINSSNVQTNDVIKYSGTDWVNGVLSSATPTETLGYSFHLKDGMSFSASGRYSAGKYLMYQRENANRTIYYKPSGYDTNGATTTNSLKNNSNWFESIDITSAGTYLCIATYAFYSQTYTGGEISLRWESNGGGFSHYVSTDTSISAAFPMLLVGVLTVSTSDIIRVVVQSVSNNESVLHKTPEAAAASVSIFKLS